MAWQYVGGTSGTGTSNGYSVSLNGTLTGGLASSPSPGDIVVVSSGFGNTASSAPAVSGNISGAYTSLFTPIHQNDTWDTEFGCFYKIMGSSVDTSLTITRTTNTAYGGGTAVQVWRGVDQTNPIDVTTTTAGAGNASAPNPPSITPATVGALLMAAGCGTQGPSGSAFTVPAGLGYVSILADGSTSDVGVYLRTAIEWASGAYDLKTATGGATSSSCSWAAATIALRPVSTLTTSAAGAIQASQSASASAAGAIQAAQSATLAASAAIALEQSATVAAEAAVQAGQSATLAAAGAIQQAKTATVGAQAAIRAGQSLATAAQAAIRVGQSATASAGAAVRAGHSLATDLNAAVRASQAAAAAADTAVQVGQSATVGGAGVIAVPASRQVSLDVLITLPADTYLQTTLSAAIQAAQTATASLSAAIRQGQAHTAAADAAVRVPQSQSVAAGSVVASPMSLSALASGAIQQAGALPVDAGAAIRESRTTFAQLDAGIQVSAALASTADALVALPGWATVTVGAYVDVQFATYHVLLNSPLNQVVTLSSGVIHGINLASPVTLAIAAESPLQVTRVSPQ